MTEMTFSNLRDNVGVDLNPESIERYRQELGYLGFEVSDEMTIHYGDFLVITPEGPEILSPQKFHNSWVFYTPTDANRTHLRTIIRR